MGRFRAFRALAPLCYGVMGKDVVEYQVVLVANSHRSHVRSVPAYHDYGVLRVLPVCYLRTSCLYDLSPASSLLPDAEVPYRSCYGGLNGFRIARQANIVVGSKFNVFLPEMTEVSATFESCFMKYGLPSFSMDFFLSRIRRTP